MPIPKSWGSSKHVVIPPSRCRTHRQNTLVENTDGVFRLIQQTAVD